METLESSIFQWEWVAPLEFVATQATLLRDQPSRAFSSTHHGGVVSPAPIAARSNAMPEPPAVTLKD